MSGTDIPDPDDAPKIKDYPGRWDEYLSGIIVATPFVLLLLGGAIVATLTVTGHIGIGSVTITGTIPLGTFALGFGALVALTWVLAAMKLFGVKPVTWIASAADSYQRER